MTKVVGPTILFKAEFTGLEDLKNQIKEAIGGVTADADTPKEDKGAQKSARARITGGAKLKSSFLTLNKTMLALTKTMEKFSDKAGDALGSVKKDADEVGRSFEKMQVDEEELKKNTGMNILARRLRLGADAAMAADSGLNNVIAVAQELKETIGQLEELEELEEGFQALAKSAGRLGEAGSESFEKIVDPALRMKAQVEAASMAMKLSRSPIVKMGDRFFALKGKMQVLTTAFAPLIGAMKAALAGLGVAFGGVTASMMLYVKSNKKLSEGFDKAKRSIQAFVANLGRAIGGGDRLGQVFNKISEIFATMSELIVKNSNTIHRAVGALVLIFIELGRTITHVKTMAQVFADAMIGLGDQKGRGHFDKLAMSFKLLRAQAQAAAEQLKYSFGAKNFNELQLAQRNVADLEKKIKSFMAFESKRPKSFNNLSIELALVDEQFDKLAAKAKKFFDKDVTGKIARPGDFKDRKKAFELPPGLKPLKDAPYMKDSTPVFTRPGLDEIEKVIKAIEKMDSSYRSIAEWMDLPTDSASSWGVLEMQIERTVDSISGFRQAAQPAFDMLNDMGISDEMAMDQAAMKLWITIQNEAIRKRKEWIETTIDGGFSAGFSAREMDNETHAVMKQKEQWSLLGKELGGATRQAFVDLSSMFMTTMGQFAAGAGTLSELGDAFADFFGDLAGQMGSFFFNAGLGMVWLDPAAGIGLMAAGMAMQVLSGALTAKGSQNAGSGGGGSAKKDRVFDVERRFRKDPEDEQKEFNIEVVIAGRHIDKPMVDVIDSVSRLGRSRRLSRSGVR